MRPSRPSGKTFLLVFACLLAVPAERAHAQATITVNSFAQSPGGMNDCTLGEAIQAANTDAKVDGCVLVGTPGADTINLPAGTYTLLVEDISPPDFAAGTGLPAISSNITINGTGGMAIIERDAGATNFRLMRVVSFGGSLTLNEVSLRGGRAPASDSSGGAIKADGPLTANKCSFIDNTANLQGGHILGSDFRSNVTIDDCTFSAGSAMGGGGAISAQGTLMVKNSTFTDNTALGFSAAGGAIFASLGPLATIENSSFKNNRAFQGGAIATSATTTNISLSVFSGNGATDGANRGGGAILIMTGTPTISQSSFSMNTSASSGGALATSACFGPLEITGSTFSGNSAADGGAVVVINCFPANLRNSTIDGNTADNDGGGVLAASGSVVNLNNLTITRNTADSDNNGAGNGGGIASSGTLNLKNTIVAANLDNSLMATDQVPDCSGIQLTSQGFNLISVACPPGSFTSAAGDQIGSADSPINPLLGLLQNNGGPTQTRAPMPGSRAIDMGSPNVGTADSCETTDQRGVARPADGNNDGNRVCDVGAVEEGAPTGVTVSIDDVTMAEGNSGTTSFDFTVSLSSGSSSDVTVDFATADGTSFPATAGVDYVSNSGTVNFAPPDTSKSITVTVNGDLLDENNETFFVNLTNASPGVTITNNQGVGTITDDDTEPNLSIGDITMAEGNSGTTNFTFTASLSPVSGRDVTVNFATENGTATQPADYSQTTDTLTIPAGAPSGTINVPVVGDTVVESNETFLVNLSNPVNATLDATLGADAQGVGTITNDDTLSPDFTLSADPMSRTVRAGNSASYTITITPNPGPINNPVNLTCTPPPDTPFFVGIRCGFTTSAVTPGANPASVDMVVVTMFETTSIRPEVPVYAGWLSLEFLVAGLVLADAGSMRRRLMRNLGVVLLLLSSAVLLTGLGSSCGQPPIETPTGNYEIRVTADSSGILVREITVTLIVQ
ncbi:MAG: Calx-beta domain-containing protein [Terriglobales bacterium]